jgi:undecaprenyl-diphosphatase
MWRKREGVYAIVLAALIAISRLYLTVHYPTDVLVSLVLGSLYGIVAYFIAKWIIKKFPKFGKVMEGEASYRSLFSKNS